MSSYNQCKYGTLLLLLLAGFELIGSTYDILFLCHVLQEQYIVDEVKDKNGEDIDVTSWKQEFVKDLPNQQNGYGRFKTLLKK